MPAETTTTVKETEPTQPFQVRMVVTGKKGFAPVIDRGNGEEKIIVLGNGLRDVKPGTPVAVTSFEEKEKVIVAEGYPLTDRMIILVELPLGYGPKAKIVGPKSETLRDSPGFNDIAEVITTITQTSWSEGQTYGGDASYVLIKKECETEALKRMVWQKFLLTFRDQLGLAEIMKEAPKNVRDEDLAETWKYQGTPLFTESMVGHEKDLEEIIKRHLAPMAVYDRMVKRREIVFQMKDKDDNPDFQITFSDCWQQHRERFLEICKNMAQVTPETVIKFLLETESSFPGPNDGLEALGKPEIVAEAREWSRFNPEATKLLSRANHKIVFELPPNVQKRLFISDMARRYLELGRKPASVEEIIDFSYIESLYPPKVEIPGLGQRVIHYSTDGALKRVFADIELAPEEVLEAESFPKLPQKEGNWLTIWRVKTKYRGSVRDGFEKTQELTRAGLLEEAFETAKPSLPQEASEFWADNDKNSLPQWPEPKVIGQVKNAGEVKAWPEKFLVTEKGIETQGWVHNEKDIAKAKSGLELAIEVRQARRNELPPLYCPKCQGEMAVVTTIGNYNREEIRLGCPSCGDKQGYPSSNYDKLVHLKNPENSRGEAGYSFEFSQYGIITGDGAYRRSATEEELNRLEIAIYRLSLSKKEPFTFLRTKPSGK